MKTTTTRRTGLSLLAAAVIAALSPNRAAADGTTPCGDGACDNSPTPVCKAEYGGWAQPYGYDPFQVRANEAGYLFYQGEDACWYPVPCPSTCRGT